MSIHTKKLKSYIKGISSCKIDAPMYIQQAVARHKRDLRDDRFYFDKEAGERPCRFLELLPHVKGKWSRKNETLILEPWQVFIIMSIFGWKDKNTNLRRYKSVYIEVPRKNGKSFLASGIGIYMLIADKEDGSEVYTAGKTRDQAKVVFDVACQMLIRLGRETQDYLGIKVEVHKIKELNKFGVFEPLASESKSLDGKNPHCAIIDEVHAHVNGEVYNALAFGMSSREQPLMFAITTAGTSKDGLCWDLRNHAIRLLNQSTKDETSFCMIWNADSEEDYKIEKTWAKVNPNYGVSISKENFLSRFDTAASNPASHTAWLVKCLNVWTNTANPWLNPGSWEAATDSSITPEQFAEDPTWTAVIGMDLSHRIDLTAISLVFFKGDDSFPSIEEREGEMIKFDPSDNKYVIFTRSFVPEFQATERASDGYAIWRREDSIADLVVCKGNTINNEEIENNIIDWCKKYKVYQVGVDPWNTNQIVKRLEAHGILCTSIAQTAKNLSPAMQELEVALISDRLKHTGDPCLQWQMEAIEVKPTENGSLFPRKFNKTDPRLRIDAGVATIIAFSQIIAGLIIPESTEWDKSNILALSDYPNYVKNISKRENLVEH